MPAYVTGQPPILIVDDDRVILELVHTRLTLAMIQITTVRTPYNENQADRTDRSC